MDLKLPLLADANLHLNIAEEALADGAVITATHELEKAEEALEELRLFWPELGEGERGLLASMARPLSAKAATLKKRIPKTHVLSEAKKEEDPEQEVEPNGVYGSEGHGREDGGSFPPEPTLGEPKDGQ